MYSLLEWSGGQGLAERGRQGDRRRANEGGCLCKNHKGNGARRGAKGSRKEDDSKAGVAGKEEQRAAGASGPTSQERARGEGRTDTARGAEIRGAEGRSEDEQERSQSAGFFLFVFLFFCFIFLLVIIAFY